MNLSRSVIGVTGMAGAGKSLVVQAAERYGYHRFAMGDIVREEARRRHLEPTPENLGKVMLELRRSEGIAVVAKICAQMIKESSETKAIIDGVRSLDEVEEFRKHFTNFVVMAVHASPATRFRRLHSRHRSDDPSDWKLFQERDFRELGVGLGNAIAMAEHMIVNEAKPERVEEQTRHILRGVDVKWTK